MPKDDLHRPGDTKSLVEQLKFIHFTLIGGCLVTMITITSQPVSSAARAYEQASQLATLKEKWRHGEWLQELISDAKARVRRSKGIADQFDYVRSRDARLQLKRDSQGGYFDFNIKSEWRLAREPLAGGVALTVGPELPRRREMAKVVRSIDPKLETLDDAKRIWNLLGNYRYLLVPTAVRGGWWINDKGDSYATIIEPIISLEGTADAPPVNLRADRSQPYLSRDDLMEMLHDQRFWERGAPRNRYDGTIAIVEKDSNTRCYLYHNGNAEIDLVPADCVAEELAIQLMWTEGIILRPPSGDFSRSFPDLDDLAKQLSALSIADLQAVFLSERNRSGEKIELVGAKFPADTVTIWGTAILLFISAYFYVVFRDFAARVKWDDSAWTVYWIGTATEFASRVAFILSLVILPLTIGYLAWRGVTDQSTIAAKSSYWFAVLLALALVSGITYHWYKALSTYLAPLPTTAR